MSKTVLSEINGFTPAPDVLVKRHGILTALVFGAVWLFCQMKDDVCRASLERIACDLNISRMSVMRHIRILVADGFLEDTTPDLRNRPHTYADTGKVAMESRLEMAERGVPESEGASQEGVSESHCSVPESHTTVSESHTTVPESHTTVPESHSHSDTESLEDSIKRGIKKVAEEKEASTTTTTTGATFKIYEQEIGPLTPIISEEIGGYLDDPKSPQGYIAEAIHEAARQNKPSWAYVRAILNRWMTEGKQARDKPRAGPKVKEPDHPEYRPYVEPLEGQYVPGPI